MKPNANFRERVEAIMADVPKGAVTTYGDVAAMAGSPTAAQIVGSIAHYGDPKLPWHRLVNRFGGLAAGFHGGRDVQAQLLEQEGVHCADQTVTEFESLRWKPDLR